jgi:hypothetical protein
MADAKKIDPFDVEALEKSLNDSATRVSTIWVSFLIFSLYLLTAATTVTHRQLFLAEPVKLPVLNIELPLWGFFWLAPILFVIFHAYVLIQLILLARTAAAYDAAVAKLAEQDNLSPEANASLRQRLANTLFAQILAGSPREARRLARIAAQGNGMDHIGHCADPDPADVSIQVPVLSQPFRHMDASTPDIAGVYSRVPNLAACAQSPAGLPVAKLAVAEQREGFQGGGPIRVERRPATDEASFATVSTADCCDRAVRSPLDVARDISRRTSCQPHHRACN